MTWLVTAFSAVFLAIGLALQNNIANMANGIIIVSSGMFKKGDYIEVDGVTYYSEAVKSYSVAQMLAEYKAQQLAAQQAAQQAANNGGTTTP